MTLILLRVYVLVTRRTNGPPTGSWKDVVFVELPISTYLGWITGASFLNLFAIGTTATDAFLTEAYVGLAVIFLVETGNTQIINPQESQSTARTRCLH
jgi:hypothetical protein